MNNLNFVFFDEFKRLDKICKDIYGESLNNKLGVTMYLDDMESKHLQGEHRIPSWCSDYNQLKRARNIRNELAHSDVSISFQLCTQADVDFIRSFYARLMTQTDPLATLHRQTTLQAKSKTPQEAAYSSVQRRVPLPMPPENKPSKKPFTDGCLISVAAIAIAILCVLLILA